jgi:glucosamine--fructose-6-phosphate aminotransferase (isomerizing)
MTDDIPEKRSGHPYIMYEMLMKSPKAMIQSAKQFTGIDLEGTKFPVFLTGNGTSYHAEMIASYPFCDDRIKLSQAFELLNYCEPKGTIAGLSHTGKTESTVSAVRKHAKGNFTIGVSYAAGSPLLNAVDLPLLIHQEPDRSLCNTMSFFGGSMAMYCLLRSITGKTPKEPSELAESFEKAFPKTGQQSVKIVDNLAIPDKIFVLGAGPNLPSARETAQKIKEASHIFSEGIELEEFNHGCTSLIDSRSLLIIYSSERVAKREEDIVRACRSTGTRVITINGSSDLNLDIDVLDEAHSPFNYISAGYFIAYYLALKSGVNPDLLRFDEPGYREYDSIVFPPGSH